MSNKNDKEMLSFMTEPETFLVKSSNHSQNYLLVNYETREIRKIDFGQNLTYTGHDYTKYNRLFQIACAGKGKKIAKDAKTLKDYFIHDKSKNAEQDFFAWNNNIEVKSDGVSYINNWVDPGLMYPDQKTTEMPPIYKYFFNNLFCYEESRSWAIDWLSSTLSKKLQTYLVLISKEGMGKNTLHKIMAALHGKNAIKQPQSRLIDNDTFHSLFNEWQLYRTFITINEYERETRADDSRVKSLVDETIEVNIKFERLRSINNNANYMFIGNENHSLNVTKGSRRFGIMDITDKPMAEWIIPSEFGKNLSEFQDNLKSPSNTAALYDYFKRYHKTTNDVNVKFMTSKWKQILDDKKPIWFKKFETFATLKCEEALDGEYLVADRDLVNLFGSEREMKPGLKKIKEHTEQLSTTITAVMNNKNQLIIRKVKGVIEESFTNDSAPVATQIIAITENITPLQWIRRSDKLAILPGYEAIKL